MAVCWRSAPQTYQLADVPDKLLTRVRRETLFKILRRPDCRQVACTLLKIPSSSGQVQFRCDLAVRVARALRSCPQVC